MDNITHTLFGATVARTSLARAGRGATAALLLASNAPDIDIVTVVGGGVSYLEWHRGPTHGPLGIVGLGLVTAGLVYGGRSLIDRRSRQIRLGVHDDRHRAVPAPTAGRTLERNASFGMLAAVSMIGVLLHILMDLPTSYGSRLLSPFDWHWYALDWMPIIDIYLLMALGAGLYFGRTSAAARRRNAAIVLTVMAANYGLRAAAHERALATASRAFGPLLPELCEPNPARGLIDRWPRPAAAPPHERGHRCLVEIAATPGFGSPFEWRLIAQLSNAYDVRTVNVLDRRFRTPPPEREGLRRTTRLYPNVWTPAVVKAADTHPARIFLGFSRFPAVNVSVDSSGVATVRWTDMRFSGGPDPPRPRNDGRGDIFGATVRIGVDGRILHAQLGGR